MSIEFEEGNNIRPIDNSVLLGNKTGSKIGDWLIRAGLAKDASSANILLIIGILVIFALSIYFFVYGFALPSSTQAPSPDRPLRTLPNSQKVQNL